MCDAIVGIDVSKETLDVNCARGQRKQGKVFANTPEGWKLVLSWLKAMGSKQAHVCLEATGRHSLGVALALHDAGHVVSIVNPAQIRDFARTKLGRNKTDKIDAALIREYAALFNQQPWKPPSPAMRRLCELQAVRAGILRNRAELPHRAVCWRGVQARNFKYFNILDVERDDLREKSRVVLVFIEVRRLSACLFDPDIGRVDC